MSNIIGFVFITVGLGFDIFGCLGLVRLPDVPAQKRIQLMETVLTRYSSQLDTGQIITVRGDKIRVSKPIH